MKKKKQFCTLCRCFFFFHFRTSRWRSRPRREMTCFAVVWTMRAHDDKGYILSSYPKALKLWFASVNDLERFRALCTCDFRICTFHGRSIHDVKWHVKTCRFRLFSLLSPNHSCQLNPANSVRRWRAKLPVWPSFRLSSYLPDYAKQVTAMQA